MGHPLCIAFIWHMHQPYYRDLATGTCAMPWVRLHATKDYLDMVTRLEAFPAIHQTVNLVPSLIDQIEEYLPPANRTDLFLEHSRTPAVELSEQAQGFVLRWFFLANVERMIRPYARYHDLLLKRGLRVPEAEWPRLRSRFRTQDYRDLQVWFNLAWIDPWLRARSPQLTAIERKGAHFTEGDKQAVLQAHLEIMAAIIPAYRDAASRGQVELTTSPYYHPILPLLCDLKRAHIALPNLPLPPEAFRHTEDARWQLRSALDRHRAAFGAPPNGMWPPEGSVSEDVVALALEEGLRWIATDEEILWRTLKRPRSPEALYRPHVVRRDGRELAVLFRDRELSDLLGFIYSQWDWQVAVADFLNRLGQIQQRCSLTHRPALASIILDGENAWEYYPNDGHDFLMGLYEALSRDGRFRCVTVSEFLDRAPFGPGDEPLPPLFSGSWINGDFATWIGHPEKNAAWTHLASAREALAAKGIGPSEHGAWKNFAAAEGSDWMWWFGDTHASAQSEEFDRLFRTHLANSYQAAGLTVPETLAAPIKHRITRTHVGATGWIQPVIDGRETSYYEWLYAGWIDLTEQYAAIQRAQQCLRSFAYGFDRSTLYVRIDGDLRSLTARSRWTLELTLTMEGQATSAPPPLTVHIALEELKGPPHPRGPVVLTATARPDPAASAPTALPCALDSLLELALPLGLLGARPGQPVHITLTLHQDGHLIERHPAHGTVEITLPAEEFPAPWPV